MYLSKLSSNDIIIDDSNFRKYAGTFRDGQREFSKGYVERDWDKEPYGSNPYAKPFDLPLIPRSEWADRIEEMERTKSSLTDMAIRRGVKISDQNGVGYCHTEDTEVLTERGWVRWPDYNWTDLLATVNPLSGMMEFQHCLQRHEYDYSGQMVYSTNRRVDFGVTPDHRMLVRKWDEARRTLSDDWTFQRAGEIGWYSGLPSSPKGHLGTDLIDLEIHGDRAYDGDDFIAMVALIVSDGWAGGTAKTKNAVSFVCFDPKRYESVKGLAARVGFNEQPGRKGVFTRWDAGALAEWMRQHCYVSPELGSGNKKVPDLIKCTSTRQIQHFLAFYGDQQRNRKAGRQYYSTSKRAIDDLQELCLRVGERGTITTREPRTSRRSDGVEIRGGTCYSLIVASIERLCIDRKKHIETETYRGPVYCATVPNGTLVTRRNGTTLISGNCWIFAVIKAQEMARVAAGLPHVPLSPASVGCKIKNFRNQGGWCSEGLEYVVKHGTIPESHWPEHSLSRSYDTPEANALRKNYRVTEFYDVVNIRGQRPADRFERLMTCLLLGFPVACGHNWWGHAICHATPKVIGNNQFGVEIWNSWTARWGNQGRSILAESKATPDDAVAVRVATAA